MTHPGLMSPSFRPVRAEKAQAASDTVQPEYTVDVYLSRKLKDPEAAWLQHEIDRSDSSGFETVEVYQDVVQFGFTTIETIARLASEIADILRDFNAYWSAQSKSESSAIDARASKLHSEITRRAQIASSIKFD